MDMNSTWFYDWLWSEASEDEKRLVNKIYDFEPLFCDMLFTKDSGSYELTQCKADLRGNGEWELVGMDLPDELEYFEYSWFHFKVKELSDCDGYYNHSEQTLLIKQAELDNDRTILHELIHLHESVINELPMYFHDMLYWYLYNDLKGKIPKLDEIISDHAHLLTGSSLYSAGGLHDILFLLKSFDLDIKMGYPLGTVFAYERADEFKGYTYINQSGDQSEIPKQ